MNKHFMGLLILMALNRTQVQAGKLAALLGRVQCTLRAKREELVLRKVPHMRHLLSQRQYSKLREELGIDNQQIFCMACKPFTWAGIVPASSSFLAGYELGHAARKAASKFSILGKLGSFGYAMYRLPGSFSNDYTFSYDYSDVSALPQPKLP